MKNIDYDKNEIKMETKKIYENLKNLNLEIKRKL